MEFKNILIMERNVSNKIDVEDVFKKTNKFLKHNKIPIVLWQDEDYLLGSLEKIILRKKGIFVNLKTQISISTELFIMGKNRGLIRAIKFLVPYRK